MKGSEPARLAWALKTLEDQHRRQPWRPGWTAPGMTPESAFRANRAIAEMMR